MAFLGGPIPLIGVGGRGAVASGVTNSFATNRFSPLATNAINTTVNVGLSAALGDDISRAIGLDLTAGQNILRTQVTPYLTSGAVQSLNQSVSNSLQGLGIAAPVVSQIFGQATTALGQTILGGLFGVGGSWTGVSAPTQQWPGAGAEPQANYGGSAFSTGQGGPDVIFSIQPANRGPQLSGLNLAPQSFLQGLSYTKVATNAFTDKAPSLTGSAYSASFLAKTESMGFSTSTKFSPSTLTYGGSNGFSL